MTREVNYICVPLDMYHLNVLVFVGTPVDDIISACAEHLWMLSGELEDKMREYEHNTRGYCVKDRDNEDIIVWLKEFPDKQSNQEVLLHELYHAVDIVRECHGMLEEKESPAYLYAYLAADILRHLANPPKPLVCPSVKNSKRSARNTISKKSKSRTSAKST